MNICSISERISGKNRISLLGFQNTYGGHTLSKGNSAFLILQSPQCFYPCKFHGDFKDDEGSEICKVQLCL